MIYLAHTAHWQFLGLVAGFLAWIITLATTGLNEWRLWNVSDVSVITSGVAWVGIWRACFFSHALPKTENCQSISITDTFLPVEIPVSQVLMVLAVLCGLAANIAAAVAMRTVYFSLEDRRNIRLVFNLAGTLYLTAAMFSLVPLAWNMNSVLNNSTINFPPEFYLPAAPVSQRVGSAIALGIFGSILMIISGLLFLSYRYTWHALRSEDHGATTMAQKSELSNGVKQGMDNPAFHTEEVA